MLNDSLMSAAASTPSLPASSTDGRNRFPPTPLSWRIALLTGVIVLASVAYALRAVIGPSGQGATGVLCFLGVVAAFSTNLRAVNWQTIGWGMALQLLLALFILRFEIRGIEWLDIPDGTRPGYELFGALSGGIKKFLEFSEDGARFVFGVLVDQQTLERNFGPGRGFIFAFSALPTIIFVSSFFTVLYFFGVLQFIVRMLARVMVYLMRTSGAESLSAAANVFMGQTEAPLIVKPYVPKMTQSELLALMVGGMATISGGLMAVYISMGADEVGILATSVMAAPCGLYLSKLIYPEEEEPTTRGEVHTSDEQPHRNVIDAAAAGASDGLFLALNVAAMLIAFLAFLALIDFLLAQVPAGQSLFGILRDLPPWHKLWWLLLLAGEYWVAFLVLWKVATIVARWFDKETLLAEWQARPLYLRVVVHALGLVVFLVIVQLVLQALPEGTLSLRQIFSQLFAPAAFLIGVEESDIGSVADLLGTKLALNEFVAFLDLKNTYHEQLQPRSIVLATYALTGFANFGSVGIQLGGIGAMAPQRRGDLARLGGRALFVGFLATLLNAAIAGMFLE